MHSKGRNSVVLGKETLYFAFTQPLWVCFDKTIVHPLHIIMKKILESITTDPVKAPPEEVS